ncbi:MAG: hypothetical protein ACAH12_02850 [Methylophilaceae bacterium]
MHKLSIIIVAGLLVSISGCATNTVQEPQIQRISPEELERIMPKPVPNLTLDEIVNLSKQKVPADQIIEKIKASNSRYDITPSQAVDLSKQGVDGKVLDFIYAAREQAVRDGFADEINKREKEKKLEQERLKREYLWRSQPYYDPWWGYSYGPAWRRPYGPSFRYGYGW